MKKLRLRHRHPFCSVCTVTTDRGRRLEKDKFNTYSSAATTAAYIFKLHKITPVYLAKIIITSFAYCHLF